MLIESSFEPLPQCSRRRSTGEGRVLGANIGLTRDKVRPSLLLS